MGTNDASLRNLALNVLKKKWDTTWDTRGTPVETSASTASQIRNSPGTPIPQLNHEDDLSVPLSRSLGPGRWDTAFEHTAEMGHPMGQYSPDTRVLA
jgi:hypothetical protein